MTARKSTPFVTIGGAALALAIAAGSASGQITPVGTNFIQVHAQGPGVNGWLNIPVAQAGILPDGWEWTLGVQGGGGPISVLDTATLQPIVTLSDLRSTLRALPSGVMSCALSFVVTDLGAGSTLSFSSAVGSFAAINPAEARASAGITLTDSNGNGASAQFLGLGGTAYLAEVNAVGVGPDFANLLPGGGVGTVPFVPDLPGVMTTGPFGTNTASQNSSPSPTFLPVGVPVTSMHTQFDFTLTPGDQASGSSNFFVRVPSPGATALLGLGGLVALRRRR